MSNRGNADNLGKGKAQPCPSCKGRVGEVTDTRHKNVEELGEAETHRARLCHLCGHKWRTIEMRADTVKLIKKAWREAGKISQKRAEETQAAIGSSPHDEILRKLREQVDKIERGEK